MNYLRGTEAEEDTPASRKAAPIARPVLAVQIADALRRMILEGALEAGEKLREKELTEHFGVSRTPLREAMKILASEGLIQLIPNRGAIVSRDTINELAEAFPVLAALEGVAGELAAQNATDADLDEIDGLTLAIRTAFAEGDRPRYFELNQLTHAAILAASKNETLQRTHAGVAQRVHRARYQANLTPSRWAQAVDEHEAIAETLRKRDAETAGRLLRQHMMNKLSTLLETSRRTRE